MDVSDVPSGEADEALYRVQQELFDIGGECACSPGKLPEQMVLVGMNECDRLIEEMDDWIKELQPLKSFRILVKFIGLLMTISLSESFLRVLEKAGISVWSRLKRMMSLGFQKFLKKFHSSDL